MWVVAIPYAWKKKRRVIHMKNPGRSVKPCQQFTYGYIPNTYGYVRKSYIH